MALGAIRLPVKGPTSGTIIGGIIGVIILVAFIATAIVLIRKHRLAKKDGPPSYKPPPPKKPSTSFQPVNMGRDNGTENQPLDHMNYERQNAEPVTDLDAYRDDEEHHNLSNDSGAASYWEEPAGGEGLPPYEPPHSRDLQGEGPEEPLNPPSLDRGGGSFMSAAMYV